MANPSDQVVRVRPYTGADRGAVRRIALATAMTGEPSAAFFDGDDFLADALTGYFTDHEPQSCFVAELGGEVAGYIIGARDTRAMDAVFNRELLGPLVWKALSQGLLLRRKNILFLLQMMKAVLGGRFVTPDLFGQYPATLHINLLPAVRGRGAGAGLMVCYLDYLKRHKVPGVRMATMSEAAGMFFKRQGFTELYRSTRPYFRHIIGRDVPLLIYGRRLP